MKKKYTLKLQVGLINGDIGDEKVLRKSIVGDTVLPLSPIYFVGSKNDVIVQFRKFVDDMILTMSLEEGKKDGSE